MSSSSTREFLKAYLFSLGNFNAKRCADSNLRCETDFTALGFKYRMTIGKTKSESTCFLCGKLLKYFWLDVLCDSYAIVGHFKDVSAIGAHQ